MTKKIIKTISLLLLTLVLIGACQYQKIRQLIRVNQLFDADKIAYNFSHMNEILPAHPLPTGAKKHHWPENFQPLPQKVRIFDQQRELAKFLVELNTTALVIIRNGAILHESYYQGTHQNDKRISWSMAKSFLSAMMGRAVESGLISDIEAPVTQYVPELKNSAYADVSIRNVLNMASGVKFNEDYMDPKSDINRMGRVLALGGSMDKFAGSLKERIYTPGTARQYVSIDTHVLGMVLREATQKSLHTLFGEAFGQTLGMGADAYYTTDGYDTAFALGGLNMRSRDYALFGQLMLQNGAWKGQQIIPADWIDKSTHASAPENDLDQTGFDYGYQWWVPKDSKSQGDDFFAVGIYGQYIYINRATQTIIIKHAANSKFRESGRSGHSYKAENIELFRTLSRYYQSQS